MNPKFEKLFEPGKIGSLNLKNRMIMAAVNTDVGTMDGFVTDATLAFYEARAKGGVGLIVVEVGSIEHPVSKSNFRQLGINDDKFLPGMTDLTRVIHKHGAKAAIQLHHAGRKAFTVFTGGPQGVAPSPVPITGGEVPRELTLKDIKRLIGLYAEAAERMRKAGFDGLEIHSAHGYLPAQFLSRAANKRQDTYGGSLENRQRFLLEVIKAVRKRVGPTYPLWCRLDGMEFNMEDGITRQEAKKTAKVAVSAGLNGIHVSGYGDSATVNFTEAPIVHKPGNLIPLAAGIKKIVDVPIIAVGRVTPEAGEKTLREGKADFIAMGRQLIADPDTPNKLASEDMQDIRKCIYCDVCVNQFYMGQPIACAINAAVGHEAEQKIKKVRKAKKVMVIGSGPAGMEAARVAALKGHKVTLYEKDRWLGGELFHANIIQTEMEDLIKYFKSQLKKLKVKINLGVEVTPALVKKVKSDICIVAVGASPLTPEIPGSNSKKVITTSQLWRNLNKKLKGNSRTSRKEKVKLLAKSTKPKGKVVIVGGNVVGCVLGNFLAQNGRKVTIVESGQVVPKDMTTTHGWIIMDEFEKLGIAVSSGVTYEKITNKGLIVSTQEGKRKTIEADQVILVDRDKPNTELFEAIKEMAPNTHAVGDCVEKAQGGIPPELLEALEGLDIEALGLGDSLENIQLEIPREFIKEAIAQAYNVALKI